MNTEIKQKKIILGEIRDVTIKALVFEDEDGNPSVTVYAETREMIAGMVNYSVGKGGIAMLVPACNLAKQKELMVNKKYEEALKIDCSAPTFILNF